MPEYYSILSVQLSEISHNPKEKNFQNETKPNIAKGTTDPGIGCFNQSAYSANFSYFLAVQDSSIGDLVTQSVSETPFDFRAEQSRALQ